MTVICTDGRVMAADSQSSRDDIIVCSRGEKLWHAPDGSICGFAGDGAAIRLARDWMEKGECPDSIPSLRGQDFKGLVLRPDGRLEFLDGLFVFYPAEAPAAIGSGDLAALGAMLAGASPKQAAEIAARLVNTVGGPIRTGKPKGGKDGRHDGRKAVRSGRYKARRAQRPDA